MLYLCYRSSSDYFEPIADVELDKKTGYLKNLKQLDARVLKERFNKNQHVNFEISSSNEDLDKPKYLIIYNTEGMESKPSAFLDYQSYRVKYNKSNKFELHQKNLFFAIADDDYEEVTDKGYFIIKSKDIFPGQQVFFNESDGSWCGPIEVKSLDEVEENDNNDNRVLLHEDIKTVKSKDLVLSQRDIDYRLFNVDNSENNIAKKSLKEKNVIEPVNWKLFVPCTKQDDIAEVAREIYVNRIIEDMIKSHNREIDQLQQQKQDYEKDVSDLNKQKEELESQNNKLKERIKPLKEETQDIENGFKSLLEKYHQNMVNIAFDGFLANKMLQAAAEWENKENDNLGLIEEVNGLVTEGKDVIKDDKEAINHLCDTIQKVRKTYSRNTILNIAICITQGFLTVFSGEPGCGKTSICKHFAKALGLTSIAKKLDEKLDIDSSSDTKERYKENEDLVNRFTVVSVERGWTSKRDFIGYYNPLSKVFDKSNRKVYDALYQLDKEKQKDYNGFPYLILLDEANLSPMEYYWSDFMSVCDDLKNSSVNLGENFSFDIPETLRFLATINNDHTTETLSPRLIDRSWIISLPYQKDLEFEDNEISDDDIKIVTWQSLKEVFMPKENSKITGEAKTILEKLTEKFREQRISVSPRVRTAIVNYWKAASEWFEKESVNIKKSEETIPDSSKDTAGNEGESTIVTIKLITKGAEKTISFSADEFNILGEDIKNKIDGIKAEEIVEEEVDKWIVAMDYAVAQRLLPKITGSGDTFKKWLIELDGYLLANKLYMSAKLLNDIIQRGDDQMKYYQFFC